MLPGMMTAGKLLVAGVATLIVGGIFFGIASGVESNAASVAGIIVMSLGGALVQVALIAYGVAVGLQTDRMRATRPKTEWSRRDGNGAVV